MTFTFLVAIGHLLLGATPLGERVQPPEALAAAMALRPVPFTDIALEGGFWGLRQKANIEGTLEQNFVQCQKTGRLDNFAKAAGRMEKGDGYAGYFFNDSDVYKAIEGASYVLARTHDVELDIRLDGLIDLIAAAQQPDGYLNSYFTVTAPDQRWTNLKDKHELYCAGHLIEAAVAHFRATGKRSLLEIAVALADHIDSVFGPAEQGKRLGVCGHPEIELALVKLAYATGEERYRKLARFFVELRGREEEGGQKRELFGEHCQDNVPIREQREVVGHAVRAMYLYCALADLTAEAPDQGALDVLRRVWNDLTLKKMYITGGIGPSASNEGFTTAYDLPNDTAYAETCAGIGLVMWAHRLALLHADASYADVMERALYNGVLSGVSLDGRRFFYVNPLSSRGGHHRQEWYACACCPPNILRLVASIGGYMLAESDGAVYVNLYAPGRMTVHQGGKQVHLTEETRYPWDGKISLLVEDSAEFDLCLRVPGWCRNFSVEINDHRLTADHGRGYLRIPRAWKAGDRVTLTLKMPIERIHANPAVKADVGRVALQRGPLVYCVEGVDNAGAAGRLRDLVLPPDAALEGRYEPDLLGGVTVIQGKAVLPKPHGWRRSLYAAEESSPVEFTAVPYCVWDNREPGEMTVWMPESAALAGPQPDPGITPSASFCWRTDSALAMCDGVEPASSSDGVVPRLTFWPHKGSQEWVQYDFDSLRTLTGVEVYFFDDSAQGGGCRLPASWRVMYKEGDVWKAVPGSVPTVPKADGFNRIEFPAIRGVGLRLEITLREDASAGILEWRVLEEE